MAHHSNSLKLLIILKIKYKTILAKGVQLDSNVIVTDQIYVDSNVIVTDHIEENQCA